MRRTALVTGTNSGVGLETALHLAALGFGVVGTARSAEKAEVLAKAASDAGVEVETAILDVTDEQACEDIVGRVEPWAVVNNAGYMNVGLLVDVPDEDVRRQLETLVVAPIRLARLAVPAMRRRGEGRIVNVSSVLARATGAMTGWYQASKHGLAAATDALRRELADDGIDVVLIEPSGLRTGIWDKARDDLERRRERTADPVAYDRAISVLDTTRPFMNDPRRVAEVIGNALTAGSPKARYRVGTEAPLVVAVEKVVPVAVRDRLARAVLRK